jgi:hypothetical protein
MCNRESPGLLPYDSHPEVGLFGVKLTDNALCGDLNVSRFTCPTWRLLVQVVANDSFPERRLWPTGVSQRGAASQLTLLSCAFTIRHPVRRHW